MSRTQKRRLARKAKLAHITMGELLRQGGERFTPMDDQDLLDHMATQVIRATTKTIRSIDKTLSLVAQSEARMDALIKQKRKSQSWD